MSEPKKSDNSTFQSVIRTPNLAELVRSGVEEMQRNQHSQISEAQRQADSLLLTEATRQRKSLTQVTKQARLYSQAFGDIVQPYRSLAEQIAAATSELARRIEPFSSTIVSALEWERSLAARMNSLATSWVLPEKLEESLIGFARLCRLSDAVHTDRPFSPTVADLVAQEFGEGGRAVADITRPESDAVAVKVGLNPQLISFPPDAYGEVVLSAGFRFRFTPTEVAQPIGRPDSETVVDPQHWQIMNELERRLRAEVENELGKLSGAKWISQRVPRSLCEKWTARQNKERDSGHEVYALIHYADFMDLSDVIVRSGNWREAFQAIFRNKDDFQVSMHRLHPVRNGLAHARPLSRTEILVLVNEATRIFRALGVSFLS